MFSESAMPFLLIAIAACMTLLKAGDVAAASVFEVSPQTCVSLYRDQACSQRINFSWSPLPEGRYCLISDDSDDALVCWQGGELTTHRHAFISVEERRYSLIRSIDNTVLGTVIVKRAWVYRGKANSAVGWRVF